MGGSFASEDKAFILVRWTRAFVLATQDLEDAVATAEQPRRKTARAAIEALFADHGALSLQAFLREKGLDISLEDARSYFAQQRSDLLPATSPVVKDKRDYAAIDAKQPEREFTEHRLYSINKVIEHYFFGTPLNRFGQDKPIAPIRSVEEIQQKLTADVSKAHIQRHIAIISDPEKLAAHEAALKRQREERRKTNLRSAYQKKHAANKPLREDITSVSQLTNFDRRSIGRFRSLSAEEVERRTGISASVVQAYWTTPRSAPANISRKQKDYSAVDKEQPETHYDPTKLYRINGVIERLFLGKRINRHPSAKPMTSADKIQQRLSSGVSKSYIQQHIAIISDPQKKEAYEAQKKEYSLLKQYPDVELVESIKTAQQLESHDRKNILRFARKGCAPDKLQRMFGVPEQIIIQYLTEQAGPGEQLPYAKQAAALSAGQRIAITRLYHGLKGRMGRGRKHTLEEIAEKKRLHLDAIVGHLASQGHIEVTPALEKRIQAYKLPELPVKETARKTNPINPYYADQKQLSPGEKKIISIRYFGDRHLTIRQIAEETGLGVRAITGYLIEKKEFKPEPKRLAYLEEQILAHEKKHGIVYVPPSSSEPVAQPASTPKGASTPKEKKAPAAIPLRNIKSVAELTAYDRASLAQLGRHNNSMDEVQRKTGIPAPIAAQFYQKGPESVIKKPNAFVRGVVRDEPKRRRPTTRDIMPHPYHRNESDLSARVQDARPLSAREQMEKAVEIITQLYNPDSEGNPKGITDRQVIYAAVTNAGCISSPSYIDIIIKEINPLEQKAQTNNAPSAEPTIAPAQPNNDPNDPLQKRITLPFEQRRALKKLIGGPEKEICQKLAERTPGTSSALWQNALLGTGQVSLAQIRDVYQRFNIPPAELPAQIRWILNGAAKPQTESAGRVY